MMTVNIVSRIIDAPGSRQEEWIKICFLLTV